MWTENDACVSAEALLALFNSSWCHAVLELTATVMGGGALKVEATHIRRVPVPALNTTQWMKLSNLGMKLADASLENSRDVLREINQVVAEALVGKANRDRKLEELRVIAHKRWQARSGKEHNTNQSET
jgi:hypothetical protein